MVSKTFTPLRVGSNTLQHRLVMAPLTRFRADDNHVPLEFVKEYYEQRAAVEGTLLITEATFISESAAGYANVPGLYNSAQVAAWKEVTDAVHDKGSFIWLQLWHLGRTADPKVLGSTKPGYPLLSSSATPENSEKPAPIAMTESQIQSTIADYARCAEMAIKEAGFDGVEIHGANGYLIDQFTQDTCNTRTDGWGGSVEKRNRFALEVAKAVTSAVGGDRVAIRLSPFSSFQGMGMKEPLPQFSHLVKELRAYKLAYLHLVESRISGNALVESTEKITPLVDIWDNQSPVFVAGGFDAESAETCIEKEYPKHDIAVVFGRYFISNPDLVFRVKKGLKFAKYDRSTFYKAKSIDGYTDYPVSKEFMKEKGKL